MLICWSRMHGEEKAVRLEQGVKETERGEEDLELVIVKHDPMVGKGRVLRHCDGEGNPHARREQRSLIL